MTGSTGRPATAPSNDASDRGVPTPQDWPPAGRGGTGQGDAGQAAGGSSARPEQTVLPEQTRDDTDAVWGEDWRDRPDDERFLRERPPHWE